MIKNNSSPRPKGGYYPGDWVRPRQNYGGWIPIVDAMEIFTGNRSENRQGVYDLYDAAIGVNIRIEQAVKSDPLKLAGAKPDEGGMGHPVRSWHENNQYHMLYGAEKSVRYAVSKDGSTWTAPDLGLINRDGSTKNNLITNVGGDIFKSVFEDPSAPPEERFKSLGCEGGWFDPAAGKRLGGPGEDGANQEAMNRWTSEEYEGPAYKGPTVELKGVVVGWTSPDRIHWKRLEQPIAPFPMDGGISSGYDHQTGTYFAYCRVHGIEAEGPSGIGTGSPEVGIVQRAIGISRTKDFKNWPAPKLILFPDGQDDLDISFYGADYFPYPGRTDLHCMLIQVYHHATDHIDSQIAFSRDGLFWNRPERKAIIPIGKPGNFDSGMVSSWGSGIVKLPGGSWGSLFGGSPWLHNMPDKRQSGEHGELSWATWKPHRFCGVEADSEGRFTIPTIYTTQKELRLNYSCKTGGWVKVELLYKIPSRVHSDVDPVLGFTFAQCDQLTEDSVNHVVTWEGKSDISAVGEMVGIRIKMFQAKVFAYWV